MRLLIVRLGALGDIVHALPAVAGLRARYPDARIDWLVDVRHLEILGLVPIIDGRISWPGPSDVRRSCRILREVRGNRYDAALDLQGLLKSAVLARLSGARRVVGFAAGHLREGTARWCYTETVDPGPVGHVIQKNLAMAERIGASRGDPVFPLRVPDSRAPAVARAALGIGPRDPYVVLNPGAAWPNKRWPPERFGVLAARIAQRYGLSSSVTWGPGERDMANRVVEVSGGAARLAPATTVSDLVALVSGASLFVAGDTGPLHIAAALGVPTVGIFGPTNPSRNGPWAAADRTVSRFERCGCHHRRRCRASAWCVGEILEDEVFEAVQRRLGTLRADA